jgi:2-oxoisovalerate dehydrogenase E1 component
MGGRRGYGATHSQSLEKIFFGTPGLQIVALNDLFDPALLLQRIHDEIAGPCLLVENKSLYAAKLRTAAVNGVAWLQNDAGFPTFRLPVGGGSDVTVVAYGGMLEETEKAVLTAFVDHELRCELVVPTRLQPLDLQPVLESLRQTRRLVVVEEGQGFAGFGAEVISACLEQLPGFLFHAARCSAANHPIPCAREQERQALPQASSILKTIHDTFES